ncbi:MAG: plasmid mobilization protein [Candidatus Fimenecus sp.]
MANEKRNRTHRVQVRLSDEEYDFFIHNLELTGLTAEGYLRKLICEKTPRVKEVTELDRDIANQLYAIGNNLNQISRRAHSMGIINVKLFSESVTKFENIMKDFLERRE